MLIIRSKNGIPVRLTVERWRHIMERHPEMATQRQRVIDTLCYPDIIQNGDFGELLAIRFFSETPLTSKFLVVVYREIALDDGFIVTAYLTNRPSTRRTIVWKR